MSWVEGGRVAAERRTDVVGDAAAAAEATRVASGVTSGARRALVGGAAIVAAVAPLVASAADEGRTLPQADSFGTAGLFAALGVGALLLIASLGRMYQRQRGIRWRFQDPDQPHHDGH